MPLFVNRGFPPRLSAQEKVCLSRHLGAWVWVGAFFSMSIVFWWWPVLGEVPGLSLHVLVVVSGLCLIEAVLGYLLFFGILIKSQDP
jgi:hypothetical protein